MGLPFMSSSGERSIAIEVTTRTSPSALLEGLEVWQHLGLLSESQIRVGLTTNASHPELLEGLEAWLRLGLLSEDRVRQLGQKYLICPLPQTVATPTVPTIPVRVPAQTPTPQLSRVFATDFDQDEPAALAARQPSQPPSWIKERLQSLQAELSVRWLLFLGVFMVVVSSGVLAASQWANFPPAAQYGVLLGYTSIFWGVSYWAIGQNNLRLTAQTLQIVTLLLVPVNFWAMDGFGLWRNPLNWIVVAFATAVLSAIAFFLWKRKQHRPLPILNYLGLSYLHWGWGLPGLPLVAVYLGIGGMIATFYSIYRRRNSSLFLDVSSFQIAIYGIGVLLFRAIFVAGVEIQQLGLAIGASGWFLSWLSHRSEEQRSSELEQSTQNLRGHESRLYKTQNSLSAGLLLLGWLVSVGVEYPWQAIAVSGLGLWFFTSRLTRFWHRFDLAAILAIGLQTIWLFWRLIPPAIQAQVIATTTQLTASQDTPWALLSLVLFPYLIFIVGLTDWLYRQQQRHLAEFGEAIALCGGTVLTVISSVNPLLRTLNLLNSTITLGIVTQRRGLLGIPRHLELLVYLTHITAIATILCAIEYLLPNLNLGGWAAILLTLMVAEWGFSLRSQESGNLDPITIWRDSAWHIGLVLAGLSYILLWVNYSASWVNPTVNRPEWGLLWLIAPLSLTGVAMRTSGSRRELASELSIVALAMGQFLTLGIPGARLIGLGIATGLMLVNTRYLRQLSAAVITVGFGLSFLGMLLWQGIPGLALRSASDWLVAGAIALTSLWLLRGFLVRRPSQVREEELQVEQELQVGKLQVESSNQPPNLPFGNARSRTTSQPTLRERSIAYNLPTYPSGTLDRVQPFLAQLYAQAIDGWAIGLCAVLLMVHALGVYEAVFSSVVKSVVATILIMGATAYRSWQLPRQNSAIWLSILALVVAQVPMLGLPGSRLISLAIATVLMLVHTRYLQKLPSAAITVGFGLSFAGFLLWDGIAGFPQLSGIDWFVVGAIAIASLWIFRSFCIRRPAQLLQIYAQATDGWAIALCSLELLPLTLHSLGVYWKLLPPAFAVLIAGLVTMGAIVYRSWSQPSNWAIYALGWSIELLTAEVLGFINHPVINLAVANMALGLIAQLAGDWWQRRTGLNKIPSSWHVIPLLYGVLGAVLRWGTFTSWTGLLSLALALIVIGVGRRREEFKPLVYLALFGVSVSAYELLFYQLSQASGGAAGDGLIVMAALGTGIMYAYRVLSPWLTGYLHLTPKELKVISHLHWVFSSYLLIAATANPIKSGMIMGLGTGAFLVQYAIFQGRNHPTQTPPYQALPWGGGEIWVYLGFLEAYGMRLYWLSTPVARLLDGPLVPWKGAIATVFAYFLYILPWESWGWSKRPWLLAAVIVPLITIGENPTVSHPVSLLIVAGFYVGLAILNQQIRFTYISAALIDWVLFRWFWHLQLSDPLWYVIPLGLSLLYIAQVDPPLKRPEQKPARHTLRLLGSGAICVVALLSNQWTGLVPGVISVLVIFAGLGLRVRSFLFVGTATFLVNAFYQLAVLIFDYPFSKWVIGLLAGITFIWIAATFETRRDQITAFVHNWFTELQTWE